MATDFACVFGTAVGQCFAGTAATVTRDVAAMGTRLRLAVSAADRATALSASLLWIAAYVAHQAVALIKRVSIRHRGLRPGHHSRPVWFGIAKFRSLTRAPERHRIRSISSGTSSSNRAPSTSKAAGGDP